MSTEFLTLREMTSEQRRRTNMRDCPICGAKMRAQFWNGDFRAATRACRRTGCYEEIQRIIRRRRRARLFGRWLGQTYEPSNT